MAITVQNTGDSSVFFDDAVESTSSDNLITAQVDPSQPQVSGLEKVSAPLVVDRHLRSRLTNFDPEQFNLSESSHLMKLLTALISGSGVGGLRRQQIIARTSNMLSGTHFLELDGFWGKLFSLGRAPEEALPLNSAGKPLDASTDVADSLTWDTAHARDGRYRSRIEQLAQGFALGATYDGVRTAAQAILNCEIEIVESWTYADFATTGSSGYIGNSWLAVSLQYGTWGHLQGKSYGVLEAGAALPSQSPLGNRGEVLIIPGRVITEAERMQLHNVLNELAPAGTMITVSDTPFTAEKEVAVRSVYADSEDWDVVSVVQQQSSIQTSDVDLYPDSTVNESARPAFGRYSGERWSYNSRIATVQSYAMNAHGRRLSQIDYQTVTFADQTSHDYVASEALVDSRQLALARATAEGVMTTYPYAEGRTG